MPVRTWRSLVLVLGESAVIATAVAGATYARLGDIGWATLWTPEGFFKALLIVSLCQICLHYADLYDLRGIPNLVDLTVRLIQALGAASLLLAVIYYWFPDWMIGRGVFLVAVLLITSFVVLWRLAFAGLTAYAAPAQRLLLVGTGPAAIALAKELHDRRQELGVEIVGFVDPDPARVGTAVLNPGIVGTIDDIPYLISSLKADRVVVSLVDARGKLPMDRLLDSRLRSGAAFDHLASVYEEFTGKIAVENLRPSWLVFSDGFSKGRTLLAAKRVFDLVSGAVGLILAGPIMLLVALLTKLTSPGPVFYHQERVGLNGQTFMVHKFRTMGTNAEAATGPVWSTANDPRVTPLGNILRRTRLDEIPQLWNVLKGEMSLVGPRPERPSFVEQLTRQIPFYGQRHVVKPGVTGWAQVRYTYGASVEDAIEKLQYDLYYIKNMSLSLDLVVALETIKTVILRKGSR
ncbi:MAG: TIGR03013 family XrtA/PEP-CTERM system glycosyltransferase [Vicinamibacterales bacterium]